VAVGVTSPVLETWQNPPGTPAVVLAGAALDPPPAAGTVETWTMGGGYGPPFLANPLAVPPLIFRVFDLRAPAEFILVTQTAGDQWIAARGDQGTTPVVHQPGFAVLNVITGDGMAGLAQGVPSGNGLVLPAAGRRTVTSWNDGNGGQLHPVIELPAPAGDAIPGAVYELTAHGYWWSGTGNQRIRGRLTWDAPAPAVLADSTWQLVTNTGLPGPIVPGNPGSVGSAALPCRWKMHGLISFYAGGALASGSLLLQLAYSNTVGTQHLDLLAGDQTEAGVPVITTADATARMILAMPDNGGGGSIFVTGGKAWRAG
jgi:hypothetical protein